MMGDFDAKMGKGNVNEKIHSVIWFWVEKQKRS